MKKNLEKEINDLKNINDYFLDLLEKIKKEFINLYELKKKEIEIKQKIINNYEIIKYNYNSIQNVHNIINNSKNNFSFDFNFNKNKDTLKEIKSIFTFMKNNNDMIYNIKEISNPNINVSEISTMIKLSDNNIAISSFDGFLDLYNQNFDLILRKKIFKKNEGINCMIQLKNGDLVLAGKKIKILNLNLENKICDIICEINNGNDFADLIQDFGNNFLITYDTNHELKLFKNYKFIYKNIIAGIDNMYKINDRTFITSSILENKINLYKLNYKKNIPDLISLPLNEEIHIKKGKNSFINLNYFYFLFIYEIEKEKKISEEKFEESKNNEEIKIENGICLFELNPKNNFKILQKIENLEEKGNCTNLVNYLNEEFLVFKDCGFLEIWKFDIRNKNIFMKNKIDLFFKDDIIINAICLEETKDIVLQNYNKIFILTSY